MKTINPKEYEMMHWILWYMQDKQSKYYNSTLSKGFNMMIKLGLMDYTFCRTNLYSKIKQKHNL
jgi:hypothetical protein